MPTLATLCLIVAILGVLLIALALIPGTAGHTPGGLNGGITLLVVAVMLYVVLTLAGAA